MLTPYGVWRSFHSVAPALPGAFWQKMGDFPLFQRWGMVYLCCVNSGIYIPVMRRKPLLLCYKAPHVRGFCLPVPITHKKLTFNLTFPHLCISFRGRQRQLV